MPAEARRRQAQRRDLLFCFYLRTYRSGEVRPASAAVDLLLSQFLNLSSHPKRRSRGTCFLFSIFRTRHPDRSARKASAAQEPVFRFILEPVIATEARASKRSGQICFVSIFELVFPPEARRGQGQQRNLFFVPGFELVIPAEARPSQAWRIDLLSVSIFELVFPPKRAAAKGSRGTCFCSQFSNLSSRPKCAEGKRSGRTCFCPPSKIF